MYVIINGTSSETLQGVQILSLPPITKPRMRTSIATIDGRPGDIVTHLGYDAYNRKIEVLLHHNYDIAAVTAFFNSSGRIIFSNEPDMVYTFETIDAFDFERAVRFRTGTVTFHVQPYKTSASEQPSEAESESFTDSEPYLFRKAPDATMQIDEIVGGSVAFNQLCNAASVTVANGRKYFMKKGTAYSVVASTGTAITGLTSGSDMVIDLTLMFGATVADYIYSLETATAGAGVAWCKAYNPKMFSTYQPYNAGAFQHVNTSAHKMTGKNVFGGMPLAEAVHNASNTSTINETAGYVTFDRRKGSEDRVIYDKFEPGKRYSFFLTLRAQTSTQNISMRVFYDDGTNTLIRANSQEKSLLFFVTTAGKNVESLTLSFYTAGMAELYYNESGIFEGVLTQDDFEPYMEVIYTLSSIDLYGIPIIVDGNLKYDGDVYKSDGTVERRYGYRAYQSGDESLANAITDGTHTVYKLTTATTETTDPYTNPQVCYPDGTEEYIDERTIPVPVGHNTKYIVPIEMTVTNSGNTDSAPSLTIEGSGAIEVTVDGLIAFEISMPSTGMIVIDSAAMDAMDGDGNLANRSVSGDYSNLRLTPGEHTIIISGDAASVSLQNVSRWI